MEITAEQIRREFQAADRERYNWRDYWQAVAEFFDINRATFTRQATSGEKRTKHLFDSTGLKASAKLAAIIHSIVTNPASQWFSMQYDRTFRAQADDEAKEWLEDCVDKMFDVINESNFSIEVTSCYRDYGNYGSAILGMSPEFESGAMTGIRCKSVFLDEMCVKLDATNRMIGYYREHNLTVEQAKMKWPDINWPQDIEDMADRKEHGKPKKIQFIEYVTKSNTQPADYNPMVATPGKNRPFKYYLVAEKHDGILKEEGRYMLGHYFFTWNRAPGEVYGRGPGFEALPDMRTLNEFVRMDLEATAMRIKPPLKTRYGNVVGDVRMVPGGLTVARDPAGLVPFETGSNVNESKIRIEDLKASVRSIFMMDELALPPRDQVGEMTAFEIQRRVQEVNQILGPIAARLSDELLKPFIEDLFNLMARNGMFNEMPASVREAGAIISPVFVNPLARAQKAEEVASVRMWMQDLIALANAGKMEALDYIDDNAMAPGLAETQGVPQKYVTDVEQVRALRQQRAQAQQEAADAENQAKRADAAYKMREASGQGGRPTEQ